MEFSVSEIFFICIVFAIIGAAIEYVYNYNKFLMVNRPRYQYFHPRRAIFFVMNRRKPNKELKDGNLQELFKQIEELKYDFNDSRYGIIQKYRLDNLLEIVQTHRYNLCEEEINEIVKRLDLYMGIQKYDVLGILEIEAIIKEKNKIK